MLRLGVGEGEGPRGLAGLQYWLPIEHATRLENDRREASPVLYQRALENQIEQQRVITSNLGYYRGLRTRQITLFHELPHGEEGNNSWKRII